MSASFTPSINRRFSRSSSSNSRRRSYRDWLRFELLEARNCCAVDSFVDPLEAVAAESPSNTFVPKIINGTPTSSFPSVGQVGDTAGFFCTGTLIAPRWVLTAAHCMIEGSNSVGNTQGRVRLGGTTYSTNQVIVHPDYSEITFGTDTANDIALMRLTTEVVGITPSPIHRVAPTVGQVMTLVGFGEGGSGTTGGDGTYGTKRVGTTPIDAVTSTLIHWNFSNNSESNTAPGDSGGPSFLDVGGVLQVAGVTSGGTLDSAALGDESYNTRVDVYQTWIDGLINPTSSFSSIQYTTAGSTYSESFDSLATAGVSSLLPTGFAFNESGSNANTTYTASTGNGNAGDTYSFGSNPTSDRAFGTIQSGSLMSTLGGAIQNRTGQTIQSITIGYTGEQWRLGNTGRFDRLDFQYSLNATSLTTGDWIDVDTLDFVAPNSTGTVGLLDGNLAANRTTKSNTISGLSISDSSTIWIRWNDFNATGSDDGLAIDNFQFSATTGGATNSPPTISTPSNVTTAYQTPTPAISFTVGDLETPATSLVVSASSSNTTVIPNSGLALSGTGANRQIVITPANGQAGTSTITLSVSDGLVSVSTTFNITVQQAILGTSMLRIVSWNLSGSSGNGSPRAGFDTLMQAMGNEVVAGISRRVDLFALQEVLSQATTSTIVAASLNNLYGTTIYASGSLDGATTGSGTQGVVYNTQSLQLLGEATVGTASTAGAPRQTLRHHFRPIGTFGESDFYVYNSHFKASDDSDSAQRRLVEAQAIRDDADGLGQGAHVIYVGDFNLFRSSEAAYQELLSSGNGQAFDPINRPGNWSDNANFLDIFTQAPAISPANGLDGGGLDDRFDFQLNSGEFNNGSGLEYRPGSYHTFGNNGSVPLNGAIDDSSSTALSGFSNRLELLTLLRNVCDHLPVVADYTFPIASTIANRQVFYNRSTSSVFGNGTGNPINAIDTTKVALLPGQTATFANYTSVANGINGLLIDILGGQNTINANDFAFATSDGSASSPFVAASATPTITVIPNGGVNGSTRVKIEFPDQSLRNTWLRTTVLATTRTGLSSNDVFYFGNVVGDFGGGNIGTPTVVRVNATDISGVRQNQSTAPNSVGIANLYDINKDGRVNPTDISIVRQNQLNSVITLFTAPTSVTADWMLASDDSIERRRHKLLDDTLSALSWELTQDQA